MSAFQDDHLIPDCYSELHEIPGFETDGSSFDFSTSSTSFGECNDSPRMLCFGDYANVKVVVDSFKETGQRSGSACTASDPVSSSSKAKVGKLHGPNRKRDGSGCEWNSDSGISAGAPTGKRVKSDSSKVTGGRAKASKKEKLGERITALQQLVSPFGKTDTASVLHEAFGYIKFLQDQVHVLSSPYLKCCPENGETKETERKEDYLKSRGLCLVPVELTLRVADSNGADLWSSAAMLNNVSSNL